MRNMVTSTLLGGIDFASIRATDTRQHDTPVPGLSHSTGLARRGLRNLALLLGPGDVTHTLKMPATR